MTKSTKLSAKNILSQPANRTTKPRWYTSLNSNEMKVLKELRDAVLNGQTKGHAQLNIARAFVEQVNKERPGAIIVRPQAVCDFLAGRTGNEVK